MRRCLLLVLSLISCTQLALSAEEPPPCDGPLAYGCGNQASCSPGSQDCGGYGCCNPTEDCGCCNGGGCNVCPCEPCGPSWIIRGGTVIMQRRPPNPAVLVADPFGVPLLNAGNLSPGYQTGFDLGVIRCVNECTSVEVRYFQIDPWNVNFGPINIPNVVFFQGQGSQSVDSFNGNYRSDLRSAELNVRRQVNSWMKGLIGFRYLNLQEFMNINQPFVAFPGGFFGTTANTYNNLYGGQIGGEGCLFCGDRLRLDGFGKAGLYLNDARSFYHFTNFLNGFGDINAGNNFRAQRNQVAFVGELSLIGTYNLTDHIALRGGYQVLWVEGLALASNQFGIPSTLPNNGVLAISAGGGAFYHGAIAGVEFSW